MIACVIPIKSTSKRLKNKNFLEINGKLMFEHPLHEALKSSVFEKIFFYTSEIELKQQLTSYIEYYEIEDKVDVIFDFESKEYTTNEIIKKFLYNHEKYDFVSLIYPTSLFVKAEDIKRIVNKKRDNNKPCVVMKKVDSKYLRCFVNNKMINPHYKNTISQDLPDLYMDAGQLYHIKREFYYKNNHFFDTTINIELLNEKLYDIDTQEDIDIVKNML